MRPCWSSSRPWGCAPALGLAGQRVSGTKGRRGADWSCSCGESRAVFADSSLSDPLSLYALCKIETRQVMCFLSTLKPSCQLLSALGRSGQRFVIRLFEIVLEASQLWSSMGRNGQKFLTCLFEILLDSRSSRFLLEIHVGEKRDDWRVR